MVKVISCPEETTFKVWERRRVVFLAGGITGCRDWQAEVVELLRKEDVILVNPRREDFDVTDSKASVFQIAWEDRYIREASIVLFWFPEETLCPITLFELGKTLGMGMTVVVGCHPNYARRLDVIEQVRHMDPSIVVQDSIKGTLQKLSELL